MSESSPTPWYSDAAYGKRVVSNVVLSFLVLFFLHSGLYLLGLFRLWEVETVLGLFCLSVPISFLVTPRTIDSKNRGDRPKTSWEFLEHIIIREPSSLAVLLLFTAGVGIGTYYFVSSLFTVEYTPSGFQVNLPGHTIYYVPIIPTYDRWQNTGIDLREGDDVEVAIIGYASTTALWGLVENAIRRIAIGLSADKETLDKILKELPEVRDYTDAAGYPDDWYAPFPVLPTATTAVESKLRRGSAPGRSPGPQPTATTAVVSKLQHYKSKDTGLTVQGLPHNTVIGIINDTEPEFKARAYEWTGEEGNKDHLVNLSKKKYPLFFDSKWSGTLWVTVNDAERARWDNSGMFFMSVKVSRGVFSRR